MPLAYADQFYVLREHIGFVRQRLMQARDTQRDDAANEAESAQNGSSEAGAGAQICEWKADPSPESVTPCEERPYLLSTHGCPG